MKPKIILVGGGGHCISVIDVIEQENRFQIAGIVDEKKNDKTILGYPVLGSDEDLPELQKIYQYAFVTIGQISTPIDRIKLYDNLILLGYKLPVIVSPRAYVSQHAVISSGTIVMHDSLVNAHVKIGQNCIINTKALIEHDSKVGDHCHISTGAVINGGVTVGRGTFIGSNSVVREAVQINANDFVKSGSIFSGSTDA